MASGAAAVALLSRLKLMERLFDFIGRKGTGKFLKMSLTAVFHSIDVEVQRARMLKVLLWTTIHGTAMRPERRIYTFITIFMAFFNFNNKNVLR